MRAVCDLRGVLHDAGHPLDIAGANLLSPSPQSLPGSGGGGRGGAPSPAAGAAGAPAEGESTSGTRTVMCALYVTLLWVLQSGTSVEARR